MTLIFYIEVKRADKSGFEFKLQKKTWTYIISTLKQKFSAKKLLTSMLTCRKELESFPIHPKVTSSLQKYLHPVPGMKFSTTSANSPNTNKLYHFVYSIFQLAKFLNKVEDQVNGVVLPTKTQETREIRRFDMFKWRNGGDKGVREKMAGEVVRLDLVMEVSGLEVMGLGGV